MPHLHPRPWVPASSDALVQQIAEATASSTTGDLSDRLDDLVGWNHRIHDEECINLNPATNTMNPRAEALLASGLGTRPSLGYPGDKYEMGLEAIEQVEIVAAELAAETFGARFAEVRVGSGALANLYAFMATCRPGDAIIAPPATIGGHVTHHGSGAAGWYGVTTHSAPVDAERYTVDVDAVAALARQTTPSLITIGGSLNLDHHPVAVLREIADEVGAVLLFDAAHLSGPIAGGAWPDPLGEGAHIMTGSTYKSLGGPPSGVLVTNEASIAERVDAIAFPGLTANFDAAKTAALAMSLLDWRDHGAAYANEMVAVAQRLAAELDALGVPVFGRDPFTVSHAFALDAGPDGGHAKAKHLRAANLLTSAIGLPHGADDGVRLGTNEMVRWGLTIADVPELAELVARAWGADDPAAMATDVSRLRRKFDELRFVR